MAKKYKVGIAGYGIVGKKRHDAINNHPDAEVIAVCDKNFKNPTNTSNDFICHVNYHELLNEPIDILIVCLPNVDSPIVTKAGLKKGLHVFCEKPPGRNVRDILEVIEVNKLNPSLKLMYGFNHRYHESVKEALSIINSKNLGEIISMKATYGKSKLITFNQPNWRTKRDIAGGGVLLDQGIHMVDLMRLFAGEFIDVYSFISNSYWKLDVEDNAYALMKTRNGIVGMLHSSATQWRHRFNLDINLEKGSIILGGILSGTKSYGEETLMVSHASSDDGGDPKENLTKYNHDPSWKDEIYAFIDAINNNTPIKHGSSQDALSTMSLVYKIYCADNEWKNKFKITEQ